MPDFQVSNSSFPPANPALQSAWQNLQWGLAVFILSPFIALFFILWALIEVGRKQFHEIVSRPINQGFAILSVLLILTACFANNQLTAFVGLFNFLPFFLVFVIVSALIQTPAQLRRIAWILVIGSVPVIIIGFGQIYWGWAGPIQILGIVINWILEPGGTPPGRMASVLEYANVFANYLGITLILSLGLWIEEIQNFKFRNLFRVGKWQQGLPVSFLSLVLVGHGAALILANSRNAWAIAFLAVLSFALYLGWWALGAAVGAIASLILWSAFGLDPTRQWLRNLIPAYFWARLTDQLYPDRPLAQLRSTQWKFAWNLALERPLTGWGLRNFTSIYEARMHYWIGHPHNLFLMLAAETGILITLLLFTLVAWILTKATLQFNQISSNYPDKLIVFTYLIAFASCTLFHLLDVTLFDARINFLGWLLLGSLCGLTYQKPLANQPK